MAWNKSDLVQTKFAEIINQTENPTILDWGAVDSGFYTAAKLDPQFRYFISTNADDAEAKEARINAISRKEFDYIIVRDFDFSLENLSEDARTLLKNYEVVAQQEQQCEEYLRTYTLLRRRTA